MSSSVSRVVPPLLLCVAWAPLVLAGESFTGRATTYGLTNAIGGSCSVRLAPQGLDPTLFVAMNGDQYAKSSACSRCLSIKGPKGTVTTFVADVCFECGHGNLDLNTALWNTIVGGDPRIEPITWQYTPCPDEKEKLCMKEGSNAQWLALQVANSRDGVKAMEIGGVKAEVIGITSFYQVSGGINLDLSKLDVKLTSTSGITSKLTLDSAKSFVGCAMPSNDDNKQSNGGGGTAAVTVDVTGVTKDLNAWRSYRRRHSRVY
jgi:expansin (peptidoglycan-binding protein)